jgi:hypothetical protein
MAHRSNQASSPLRLVRLGRDNNRVLVEALATLAMASLAIRLLPFRRTVEMMQGKGGHPRPDPAKAERLTSQCRWAVTRWADRVPWRAVCFQRGLALHLMLRRRGIPSRSIMEWHRTAQGASRPLSGSRQKGGPVLGRTGSRQASPVSQLSAAARDRV